jgi:hypothetical protein
MWLHIASRLQDSNSVIVSVWHSMLSACTLQTVLGSVVDSVASIVNCWQDCCVGSAGSATESLVGPSSTTACMLQHVNNSCRNKCTIQC